MALRLLLTSNRQTLASPPSPLSLGLASFSSKSPPYFVKVGIPEFLNGIGKGVEAHMDKLEAEIGNLQKLLVTRTPKVKKLGIPCKHRKLVLKYVRQYQLGLWKPQAEPVKSSRVKS